MKQDVIQKYAAQGFHIEHGVFNASEVAKMIEHYMTLRAGGPREGDSAGVGAKEGDPWKKFPRMIDMHKWDDRSREWMQHPRLSQTARELLGQPVRITQTMLYFKPAGGRGQSFHQDNLYLKETPIMGAWVALDPADAENGAMEMIAGSHLLGLLPVGKADETLSVTSNQTVIPEYLEKVLIKLEPGDAVFFGGLTIHGSMPNRSKDRFRRSFICHFAGETTYPILAPEMGSETG